MRGLNIIGKILYTIMVIIVILILILAILQKTSDNKFSIGGIKIFAVITGSMIPVYDIGDILIVKDVLQHFAPILKFVILSKRSASKNLRIGKASAVESVRRSFDSFRKSSIFFSRSG